MKRSIFAVACAAALIFSTVAASETTAPPMRRSSSKELVMTAFREAPASFQSAIRAGRIRTELCFDRCYEFEGDSGHPAEYWDAIVVFMATIGMWDVPDIHKDKLSSAANEIVHGRSSARCSMIDPRWTCVGNSLAANVHLRIWEVNYDEGNVCTTRLDIERTFTSMTGTTVGPTQCRKVAK